MSIIECKKISYDYFGNTSLRVRNLLYNFESQLILFEKLFENTNEADVWTNNSELQIRYLELLAQHDLLKSKNETVKLGTKDARVKSAPLEDYNLVKRKEKEITEAGYELLELIKSESYKIDNKILQIDLISLFFLKATLNFSKSPGLLQKYLEVFKEFNYSLPLDIFKFLPLINNFEKTEDFIESLKSETLFLEVLQRDQNYLQLNEFIENLKCNKLDPKYFKTAKGEKTPLNIIDTLREILLPFRESNDIKILEKLFTSKYEIFKKLYLCHLTKQTTKKDKIEDIKKFCEGSLEDFGKRFFCFIFEARILSNLNDYLDLNRRYLNLTGIFEFNQDKVDVNKIFTIILEHSKCNKILKEISKGQVSTNLLWKHYSDDLEFQESFKKIGISRLEDIKTYKQDLMKQKLNILLKNQFTKEKIIEILGFFSDRANDSKIFDKVTTEATIPTIFEYIIAIAWYYIDDNNIERILEARLSLDSNLLPKSHAVGGDADLVYSYDNHFLMIEVTLTQSSNQRRAEMESVSRHLGNLLLSLNDSFRQQSYAIFIAPYLDKNVLNDFRGRLNCYFENEKAHIKGMKILALSSQDIIKILNSNLNYKTLKPKFQEILNADETWGSKWYKNYIQKMINEL